MEYMPSTGSCHNGTLLSSAAKYYTGLTDQNNKVRIDVTAKESLKSQNDVTESG